MDLSLVVYGQAGGGRWGNHEGGRLRRRVGGGQRIAAYGWAAKRIMACGLADEGLRLGGVLARGGDVVRGVDMTTDSGD